MNRRLNGNTLLVIDPDSAYVGKLSDVLIEYGASCHIAGNIKQARLLLNSHEFDMVVCNYHLPDGMIHQLINWCQKSIPSQPIFIALGNSYEEEEDSSQEKMISDYFSKQMDPLELIKDLSILLFDFEKFHESLRDLGDPKGLHLELLISRDCISVKPSEIFEDSIELYSDFAIDDKTTAILRASLYEDGKFKTHLFTGQLSPGSHDCQNFLIQGSFGLTWRDFLAKLEQKQLDINQFLRKAAGA